MNIAKLNTMSLDDKTFIIKRGTSGGANIKNQNKVVDITENGTVDIVPDAGYTGLAKVEVNVNVASSGGELEGEDVLLKRNGWYWKFTEAGISSDIWCNILVLMPFDMGICYFDGKTKITRYGDYRDIWYNIGYYLGGDRTTGDYIIYAISESIGCSVAIDEQTVIVGDSVFEIINQIVPMTEVEFEAYMLENMYLQRITKEEYESLIIK